jgi:hypothetical protein
VGNDYVFVTVWRVPGTVDEVMAVLGDRDADALCRWWPSVYLAARLTAEGAADGIGREVALHTMGWLPYTLNWTLRITSPITHSGFSLTATGDLNGTGVWTFRPDGPEVEVTYDWRVSTSKPLLRRLTWLLRPIFAANHRWAMRQGEQSLRLELRRRRAASDQARAEIPPPPPPTFRRLAR